MGGWIKTENYAPWLRAQQAFSPETAASAADLVLTELTDRDQMEAARRRARYNGQPASASDVWERYVYASESGSCERKIGFRMLDYEQTDPAPPWSLMTFWMGNTLHALVQQALRAQYPAMEAEVPWTLGEGEAIHGRADAVYEASASRVCVEIKSMAPYSFNRVTKGEDAQPEPADRLQASLGALALDCQYTHIVYVNKSASYGREPIAEWIQPLDRETTLVHLARLEALCETVNASELPEPRYQRKLLKKPGRERWPCGYCGYRTHCQQMPKGNEDAD